MHGDLHADNIVCLKDGRNEAPTLIDFTQYKPNSLVYYDYAYLEFDLLLQLIPPLTEGDRQQWFEFGRQLAHNVEFPPSFSEGPKVDAARKLLAPLRQKVQERLRKEKQFDDFASAYLIASIAVALNYFRKVSDEYERKLGLLVAAQNLHELLRRCQLQQFNSRGIAEIEWVGRNRAQLDSSLQQTERTLQAGLLPSLRERRSILFLGPEFVRWLGFPSERSVAEIVARELGQPVGGLSDIDDPANFNSLLMKVGDTDRIRVSVGRNFVAKPEQFDESLRTAQALIRAQWLAVVDWSLSPDMQCQLALQLPAHRRAVAIVDADDLGRLDLSNVLVLPWVYLRGTVEESRRIVLGRELRLPQNKEFREKALSRLFKTGLQDAATTAVFVGYKGALLTEIYSLAQSCYQNQLDAWAVGTSIENDPVAQNLRESDGLHLASLSPDQLCSFLAGELPEITIGRLREDRYVMRLAGIDVVSDTEAAIAPIIRRVSDHSDKPMDLPIPLEKFDVLSEYLEILYENVELDTTPRGSIPGDLYWGHKVTYKELALGIDAQRSVVSQIMQSLVPDLNDQAPRRLRLLGEPGAGTSTAVRRIGWNVYQTHHLPVAFIRRSDPGLRGLRDAVSQFRDLVLRSFLLIAEEEYIVRDDTDHLFEFLQSKNIPVVVLFAGQAKHSERMEPAAEKRRRHFNLRDRLSDEECCDLRRKVQPYVSDACLRAFETLQDDSLFINLLAAFEERFIRLGPMVHTLLLGESSETKDLLVATAFCNVYGHRPAPLGYLTAITGLSRGVVVSRLEALAERLIFTYKSEEEITYACRHDLIATQILRELWGTESEPDSWKLQLSSRTTEYLQKLGWDQAGNAWQRDFVTRLLVGEFDRIEIKGKLSYKVSRLMSDIESSAGRGLVFKTAAERFPDEPHFLAQYGRYLYDEDTRFEAARELLRNAFELTGKRDTLICHMLGMSYRRELHEYLEALGRNKRSAEEQAQVRYLLENAIESFRTARELDRENVHSYASHVECLIDLIEHGFRQFGQSIPNAQRLAQQTDLRYWLDAAFRVLDEAEVYLEYAPGSHLGQLEIKLQMLRGDLGQAIQAYQSLLDRSRDILQKIDPIPVKHQLARCFYQRGLEGFNSANERTRSEAALDFAAAAHHLEDLIRSQPTNPYNLGFWFQCARADPHMSKALLTERLESYYSRTESLDGAFYLMCLFFVRGLEEENPSAFREFSRYLGICQHLAANLTHRLHRREWLGPSYTLIPNRLVSFDTERDEPITTSLLRIDGIIKRVAEAYGEISILPYGQEIYFQALRRERKFYASDDGKRVTFNVVFTYDKPIAYDVEFAGAF